MKKRRVAVLGKGTAGTQALIHFNRFLEGVEIVWYFDPKKPAQSVGEGSTLDFPTNLYHNLGFFHEDLKRVNGTFKTGIYKENWGSLDQSFFHHFNPPDAAYHFSAVELQDYIYEKMKDVVTVVEGSVELEDVDADFILDSSGRPENFSDFEISEYIPVNAARVVQCAWDYPRFDYTLTIAGKHGWIFGIPLQNRCSIGYIYNKDISNEEDLLEEMNEIFDKYNLVPSSEPNNLSFKNYYRKQNYSRGGSVVHNGNASFFLEPLEATSVGTMDMINRMAFDVWTGSRPVNEANEEYLKFLRQTEFVIMMHYAAGSSFKTDFWDFAEERGIKKLESSTDDQELRKVLNTALEVKESRFAPGTNTVPEYGPWWIGSFIENINGLGLNDKIIKIFN